MATPALYRFRAEITHAPTEKQLKKAEELIAVSNELTDILEVHSRGFAANSQTEKYTGASCFLPYRGTEHECNERVRNTIGTFSNNDCKITNDLHNKMEIECPVCPDRIKHGISFTQDHTIPASVPQGKRALGDYYTASPCETMPYECFNRIIRELTSNMTTYTTQPRHQRTQTIANA